MLLIKIIGLKIKFCGDSNVCRLKILAAEDDKISRRLISAIVKENSKELLVARTGIER
jgi:CheY-like chemotaxis protein